MMPASPFALHGSEKMIYDVRMGPQCLFHDGEFFAAYQANPEGGKALPHIIKRVRAGEWSAPVVLGDVATYDHHFAPVIWIDATKRIHVLYHCHIYQNESVHRISIRPLDITAWEDGPTVAPSISYPRIFPLPGNRLLLFHRPLGHMGYWTYQISADGGYSWARSNTALVDFDHRPEVPGDDWAGSYHSSCLSPDRQSLCLAFVYWDERLLPHPRYGKSMGHRNRYHLYYARLDLATGQLLDITNAPLPRPLNRKAAQQCLVWDTGDRLTNMPTMAFDRAGNPCFLLPVSGERPDDCAFWFIHRNQGSWARTLVTETNDTWNAAHLTTNAEGQITAYLVAPYAGSGNLPYGGGQLQEWRSDDDGQTWRCIQDITPQAGILCNNPRPVEDHAGVQLPQTLVFFGWPGPQGICQGPDGTLANGDFTGQAYLWQNGAWL